MHLEGAQRDRAESDPTGRGGRQGEPHEMVFRPGAARQPHVREPLRLGQPRQLGDFRR